MGFKAQPCDEAFLESAPVRDVLSIDIAKPAAEVWAELTEDNPLSWCRALKDITWTSPRPFGVGTTRTARALGGVLSIDEHFFIWEEGRRKAFYVLESSAPLFRRFAEDYLVEETSAGNCRFTWTIAAEPTLAGRLGGPLNSQLFASLFRDTRRHYGAA